MQTERIGPIVGLIYDAALRPALWPEVVARISELLNGSAGLLLTPLDAGTPRAFFASVGLSDESLRQYAERYHALDVWTQAAVAQNRFTAGQVVSDEELLPRAEFLGSVYYKELLQPAGIARLCAAAIFDAADADLPATALSIYGGLEAPAFDGAAKETMSLLVPHLSRALGVMYRLRLAESQVAASLAALDHVERGILLLAADGRVRYVNRRAGEILGASDDLEVVELGGRRRLVARDAERDQALREWLASALSASALEAGHFLQGLALPRRVALPPLYLSASRLASDNPYGIDGEVPAAIVFVSVAECSPRLDIAGLRALYRLTSAEASLVESLARGARLTAIAEAAGLSVATLRDRLKSVFAKTGARRQAEVVRLALSFGTV